MYNTALNQSQKYVLLLINHTLHLFMTQLIEIKEGSLETVVALSQKIPEFTNPHGLAVYKERLKDVPSITLVAYVDGRPAGFKVGYERDGYFYSWMGAILPPYRRLGLARQLAEKQEAWAKGHGYPHVTFKTRNRLKPMLIFALSRGFDIIEIQPEAAIEEYRIILRKVL
ncbi:MAG: GNAT family N-acetyltransferase [Bacteroidota bacterium]